MIGRHQNPSTGGRGDVAYGGLGDLMRWRPAALLIALTMLVYLPAYRNGFIWDDDQYVTENPTLTDSAGLARIWFEPRASPQYYPLVFSSFWIEHALWGIRPLGYHLTNAALHAANAILVWRILRALGVPWAFFGASLFALHPVHVESVAWITERKNVLSGFFYLASLSYYLRLVGLTPTHAALGGASRPGEGTNATTARMSAQGAGWTYAVSFALFVCALLSKSVTASLPAAILLILWWKRGRIGWADVRPLIPFFAAGLVAGLSTAWLEREHVGAEGREWNLTPVDRCLIAGRALWFYLGKLAWPHPLIFIYPRWTIDARQLWQLAYPIAFVLFILLCWLARRRWGRVPTAAALFFAGTLAPALGFLNVYPMRFSFVADHFQYLASIAPLAVIGAILSAAVTRMDAGRSAKGLRVVVAGLQATVLLALAVLTWRQCRVYKDAETLWNETLAVNPKAWIAHNNLATRCATRGEIDAATRHLATALDAYPYYAEGQNNLGMMLLQLGRPDEALARVREAIRLDPRIADAYSNLGLVLIQFGRNDEAIANFRKSIELKPGGLSAHYNLGCVLLALGRVEEAIDSLRSAERIDTKDEQTQERLRVALAEQARRAVPTPTTKP